MKKVKILKYVFLVCIVCILTHSTVYGAETKGNDLKLDKIGDNFYLRWTNYNARCKYSLWRSEKPYGNYTCIKDGITKNRVKISSKTKKTYYYKIRPYIVLNRMKIYGKFSNMCPGNRNVTVVLFVGQSNMAGRGDDLSAAPYVELNAGWEFRAISDPTRLYRIKEPFGKYENNPNGINDVRYGEPIKTGSMVSMVAKTYFEKTGIPIVGVSASKGGRKIECFEPGTALYTDMEQRLKSCLKYLDKNGYNVEHVYMAWHQGEADTYTTTEEYEKSLNNIVNTIHETCGVEMSFVSYVSPSYKGSGAHIRKAQKNVCDQNAYCKLASTAAKYFYDRGLLKSDNLHYTQIAYNIVGKEMGTSMAKHTNTTGE